MIRFENVTKNFKDKNIIKNLSLNISEGEIVAFIGASGCGKTTTLKMINRLINPTSGKIFINEEDINSKNVIDLRRNIGYVIQQTGLFPHMTVKENIEIISKVQKKEKDFIEKKTMELMEMIGLNPVEFLNRYTTDLSGGQQQRIGVARAFAADPDIILMDEPFSALDPITRNSLQDELIQIQLKLKKTIVFVTHDMDEAIKIADRICIMDAGEVIQYDIPENILKYPKNVFVSNFVGKNRIWSSPEFIKAEDIMLDTPITCFPNTTLLRCMEKMRASNVDSLMIVENKKLIGTINAMQIHSQQDKALQTDAIMKKNYLSVSPDDTFLEILKVFDENNVSSIPVVSEDRILLGIITKSSLVTTLSQQYLEEEV